MQNASAYDASTIQVLEGLEAVRRRPAMYIGDVGARGLHHLVYEVVDNSIDEALAGFCKEIKVNISKEGAVTVDDDGRGIPAEKHAQTGKSALEVVMTILHAGGKFDNKTYKVSGGLHGVGVSCVNALSEWMEVRSRRGGKEFMQKYARGIPQGPVSEIGTTPKTGTTVSFKPDSKIFETLEFKFETLSNRLRELAYLNRGIRITLADERDGRNETFHFSGGIIEFVSHLNKNKTTLHPVIYFEKETDHTSCEIAIQYNDSYSENIFTFVNSINTVEGGTHLMGFRSALTRSINDYAKENKLLKEGAISGEDLREGLCAVVSVKIQNPQFEGQTKTKLGNTEVKGIMESIVGELLRTYLEEHPADSKAIVGKGIHAMEAREAAQKAKELIRRKGALESSVLPGKLADCADENPVNCELFIVEGDSAGGCFSGDTKVALADGRNLSFRELAEEENAGKKNYCYTISKDGSIAIELIKNARMTRKNAEVIKLILDNGEEIVCTPDHLFMLKDGSYAQAQNLHTFDSIMPLNRKLSKIEGCITIKGYEMVYDQKKSKWIFTHMLSDQYNLRNGKYAALQGSHKHHVDFNKLNNNPDNILRMQKEEHILYHSRMSDKLLHREDIKQKAREAHLKPEYRKKVHDIMSTPEMKSMLSKRAKIQWENAEYKNYMAKKYIKFYNSNVEYQQKTKARLRKQKDEYWASESNRIAQSKRVHSHFEAHPERKEVLRQISNDEWNNPELKAWRSAKTKEQWSADFRKKRKEAYNQTYLKCSLDFMKKIFERDGSIGGYDAERIKSRNKNLLKKTTLISRFFGGNENALQDAVINYNHKIKNIEWTGEKTDVYDLEVEGTHNFALTSGVFVHNSSKQGRDRKTQAILPLRGKILNVEKASVGKLLESVEIRNLIMAIGTNFGSDFDISKLRYHKIVIMTDADVDGAHIRTLLLTLFFRYLKPLVEMGNIYIAQPPLFKLKVGNKEAYAYSDAQLAKTLEEWGSPKNYHTQRYKGLGEMNPTQLWETTMDPKTRSMLKVTIDDAMKADELFTLLMGDIVEPRRKFIEDNAKYASNIDI